jgi:hypothetical protein
VGDETPQAGGAAAQLRNSGAGEVCCLPPAPYTGHCLSLEGPETDDVVKPDNGTGAQQEPCERQHDALWWFRLDGNGHVLARPYLKNSAGRYPCLEADNGFDPGWIQVQGVSAASQHPSLPISAVAVCWFQLLRRKFFAPAPIPVYHRSRPGNR